MIVGVIDYNAGNLFSVVNSLNYLGLKVKILRLSSDFEKIDRLILPGVGAFGAAMQNLEKVKLIEPILNWIESKKPFLGICLGLQLLFDYSEESEGIKGLSVLKGSVKRFTFKKVPHIGWNLARPCGMTKFAQSFKDEYYYFVHSYYVEPEEDVSLFRTEYSINFVSGVQKDNLVAVQFHPEKSGSAGLTFLKNWVELC